MAIDSSFGTSTAVSLVSLEEYNAYMAVRVPNTGWDVADDAGNEAALVTAMRRLMQESYKGQPVKPINGTAEGDTQALPFPRFGVESKDGWTYLHTEIPPGMKVVQFETAYAIQTGDLKIADTGLEQFTRAKVGPLDVTIRKGRKGGALPEHVRRGLEEFTVASGVTVQFQRS